MSVDLTTQLGSMTLTSPVLVASGCGGTGREMAAYLDPRTLGGFVTRSVTLDRRTGAPTPRIVETPSGLLHAVGLPGEGLQSFLATELPALAQQGVRTIVSVAGTGLGEYAELARRVGQAPALAAVEVNLSMPQRASLDCPGADPFQAARVVRTVRDHVPRGVPVLAKLAPDVTRVVDVAAAVAEAGADAVVLVNAAPALAIDPDRLRPGLGATYGGLSGPALRPVALRCVWQVHAALPDLPLVGVGGIASGRDAAAFLAAGASAVGIGTAALHDPTAPARLTEELSAELRRLGLTSVADVVGVAHRGGVRPDPPPDQGGTT